MSQNRRPDHDTHILQTDRVDPEEQFYAPPPEIVSNGLLPVTREAVEWAYRMVLGRAPESETVIGLHMDLPSVEALRARFRSSPEATCSMGSETIIQISPEAGGSAVPEGIIERFPAWSGHAEPDSFRDFLGTRTRCAYLPEAYAGLAGTVEGYPGTERAALHDVAEWIGLLSAVLDAGESFVGVELGAGWGPWVVAGAAAARIRGIRDIKLAAVEGAASHVAFLRQHFADNDLLPDDHIIMHAAVGTYDGVARFPRLHDPVLEWSAEALYEGAAHTAGRIEQTSLNYDEIPCVSVPTLLSRMPPVDVIHMDIQGSERDVVRESIGALSAGVRRLVIGTHGRDIEADLLGILATAGWVLEVETRCMLVQRGQRFDLFRDGVQVWRNPARV
jgi:FkbM family methyltransferase